MLRQRIFSYNTKYKLLLLPSTVTETFPSPARFNKTEYCKQYCVSALKKDISCLVLYKNCLIIFFGHKNKLNILHETALALTFHESVLFMFLSECLRPPWIQLIKNPCANYALWIRRHLMKDFWVKITWKSLKEKKK